MMPIIHYKIFCNIKVCVCAGTCVCVCMCVRVCDTWWNKTDNILIISGTGVHYIILLLWVLDIFSLKVKIKKHRHFLTVYIYDLVYDHLWLMHLSYKLKYSRKYHLFPWSVAEYDTPNCECRSSGHSIPKYAALAYWLFEL